MNQTKRIRTAERISGLQDELESLVDAFMQIPRGSRAATAVIVGAYMNGMQTQELLSSLNDSKSA